MAGSAQAHGGTSVAGGGRSDAQFTVGSEPLSTVRTFSFPISASGVDDEPVVARSTALHDDVDGSSRPAATTGPVAQRQDDGAPGVPAEPEATSTEAGPAGGNTAGAGTGAVGPADLDELSRRLYDRLRDRLRSELRSDRERVGLLVDHH